MTVRLWSPVARDVTLVTPDGNVPMRSVEDGWWAAELPVGTDYLVSVDRGEPVPDPRSVWQPSGVDGPSRTYDHSEFTWTDAAWTGSDLATGVVYELHVGTFTPDGTFDSAIDALDHLTALGVTMVELMPPVEFPGARGWGYDGVRLFAPHHAYGGPDGLKRLIDACHRSGLGVLIDVVYNHIGPGGDAINVVAPYLTDRHETPWGLAFDLDGPLRDEVRRFIVDNAVAWLRDFHADGLRLDAVHAIIDTSDVHILEDLSARVHGLEVEVGRRLWLVAESDLNEPHIIRPRDDGGYGMDAQWSDDLHHALHVALTGERDGYYADFGALADIATALTEGYVYAGRWSSYRGRIHGTPATDIPAARFLGYLQTHDQVGNRARGERITQLTTTDRAMAGAALALLGPAVPMLFQGEEWAAATPFAYFTDHQDPTLARAVSEGRQREFVAFGWDADAVLDPQDPATFAASVLDWSEVSEEPHRAVLTWYRDLIALRQRVPELHDGTWTGASVACDEQARWLTLARGPVIVAVNLADDPQLVPIAPDRPRTILLANPPLSSADEPIPAGGTVVVGPAELAR